MTRKARALLLGTILIVIIYLSFKLPNDEARNIDAFNENGIGTITHLGLKTIDIGYDYQGNHFTYTRGIPFSNLTEGEQYNIEIYKKNPSRILVCMERPYIDTSHLKWGFIKPAKVKPLWIDDSQVEFTYILNGTNYKRIQEYKYSDSIPKDLSNCKVIYRLDRPDISYLVTTTQKLTANKYLPQ